MAFADVGPSFARGFRLRPAGYGGQDGRPASTEVACFLQEFPGFHRVAGGRGRPDRVLPSKPGFFDHRLRSRQQADECWRYIRQNPVRAGMAEHEDDWPWAWWPQQILVPE